MFRYYFAFLRGAARVFDKDWGMSLYGQARLHEVLPRARWAKYDYLWSIRRPYYFALAALVLFLITFRTYRIVRWIKRRRAKAAASNSLS